MNAHPEDVASTEAIVQASYALLSGRAGEPRDWDRFRTLYAPGARLIPIERDAAGIARARVLTPDEWIAARADFFARHSFFEYETSREETRLGRLTHVWSRYEAAESPGGPPIRRGANSIQLWHDGTRWWILSIAWDAIEALGALRDGRP